jgi:hypothetical protein
MQQSLLCHQLQHMAGIAIGARHTGAVSADKLPVVLC